MIPMSPIHITVSGNKCGGCCRTSTVRGEAPPHYIVVVTDTSKLTAISQKDLDVTKEAEIAKQVFDRLKSHFRENYAIEWDELPIPMRPIDLTHAPSINEVRTLEAAAMGFVEGVKKGKSSSGSLCTPILRAISTAEDDDTASHGDS